MNRTLKATLLLAGLITLTALAGGRARPALAQFPPGAGQHSPTFQCTRSVASFTVPAGVTQVTAQAHGAQGGSASHTGSGGQGGVTTAILNVTPGQVLHVYVGCSAHHGSWGFGNGGGSGNADNPYAYSGWSGGGGSAVTLANGTPLIVAGGGGGGGGNGLDGDAGGYGGNGGLPAGNGQNGSNGAGGGLGGHQSGRNGSHGTHSSDGDAGGGGGGGGGGYHGGDGGHGGNAGGGGGGGGGGGSSFATPSAIGATFGTSPLRGNGLVVLSWTPALVVNRVRPAASPAPVEPRCTPWSGPLGLIIPWQNCTG